MRPGDVVRLRSTNEPVTVIAVLDAAGTLLVQPAGEDAFQATRDELAWSHERDSCSCCG